MQNKTRLELIMADKNKVSNANNYHHKGVVVLKFEQQQNDDGTTQTYATGFDLDNPDELLTIALMSVEGYKKQIAQFKFGVTEKIENGETFFLDRKNNVRLTKEQYKSYLETDSDLNRAYASFAKTRRDAETIATKQSRVNPNKPVVLMFDGANKLGEISGISLKHNDKNIEKMAVYEARWINGIAGNSSIVTNNEVEQDFTLCHRKILGNISIKYDETNRPVWGECHAIDRIKDLKTLNGLDQNEAIEQRNLNRDLLRYALSNTVETNAGYKAERKPFTYFNVLDKENNVVETIRLITEEYSDSRRKKGDNTTTFEFQRPYDAPRTLEAYMQRQDRLSMPLLSAINSGDPIQEHMIVDASKADRVRAVLGALVGFQLDNLVDHNLAVHTDDPSLKKKIYIINNDSKKLYTSLANGEQTVKMLNGTTYPIGPKYLQRFISDVMRNADSQDNYSRKPISAIVNIGKNTGLIHAYDEGYNLTFSPMYICPKKWHENTEDKTSSVFTSLITIPAQSFSQAEKERLSHKELTESHNPEMSDFKLINQEYARYFGENKAEIPSFVDLIEQERKRIIEIEDTKQAVRANDVYCRIFGNTVPVETKKERFENQQTQKNTNDFEFGN